MKDIYFDNGSTSFPKAPGVGKAIYDYIEDSGINVSRGGYSSSYALAERILGTRKKICDFFGFTQESNVIFTPNVTFGLNYLIHGLLEAGDELMITSMEHNAVARPAELARARGVELSIARCDKDGNLDINDFKSKINKATKAVMMLHGSNVSGSLMPIIELGKICRDYGAFFIVDVAQTAGVFHINMKDANIDGLAFTGHKGLLGPQGIGGLVLGDKLAESIRPVIQGGTGSKSDSLVMPEYMPDKFEPGTMNIPGILGLSAAMDYLNEKGIDSIREKEQRLAGHFISGVEKWQDIRIVGSGFPEERCPIVSLDFTNMDNAEVAFRLDSEFGIMTRCGMHCAPMAHRTLETFPQGTVRFSFGHNNTEDEVAYAIDAINRIVGTH